MVMYNYTKLRILYTIKYLNEKKLECTSSAICKALPDVNIRNVRRCLKYYFDWGIVTRKPDKKYHYSYSYTLTAAGLDKHDKLKKRYEDRKDLKLRNRIDIPDVDEYY